MIEFDEVSGGKVIINPEMVEAIEESTGKLRPEVRAGIKISSGKPYHVEGSPQEVKDKLFPPTSARTSWGPVRT